MTRYINLSLKQSLIFSDRHILWNYALNIRKLTAGQWEWIFHAPIIAQRLILQQWEVKFMTPITPWNEDQQQKWVDTITAVLAALLEYLKDLVENRSSRRPISLSGKS